MIFIVFYPIHNEINCILMMPLNDVDEGELS